MNRNPAVYILASKFQGVLYTGVTSNLPQRVWQHKQKLVDGFCKQYNLDRLIWFELHGDMYDAIVREKQIKKWKRAWKIKLIDSTNPKWNDLYNQLF